MFVQNGIAALDQLLKTVKVRYLGLGLMLAWVYCSWFANSVFPAECVSVRNHTLAASILFSTCSLLGIAFRPNRQRPIGQRTLALSALIVTTTTLALIPLCNNETALPLVLAAAGGFCSSPLWVAWGELFCQVEDEKMEACIPSSLAAFAVAAVIISAFPQLVSGVMSALLPAVSCIMLLLCKREKLKLAAFPKRVQPLGEVLPSLVKLALCSMVCSIANGYVSIAAQHSPVLLPTGNPISAYIAGSIVAGLLAAFTIAHTRRINFSFLYEWAIPIIVFSLALKAIGGPIPDTIALVLSCTATLYVEVLFYAIFAKVTARRLCLPSEAFGLFRAIVQLGFFASNLLVFYTTSQSTLGLIACLTLNCLCVIMLPLFIHLQARLELGDARERNGACGTAPQTENAIPSATEQAGTNETAVDSTAQAVKTLAAEYKLSPRETEILHYLARGRSVPYMRDVLVISKSTIETHIKHIYAKVGVHYKQDLIDLIERTAQR